MITMPMCWKCCYQVITEQADDFGYTFFTLIGCEANDDITSYNDARTMCPLIGKDAKRDSQTKNKKAKGSRA